MIINHSIKCPYCGGLGGYSSIDRNVSCAFCGHVFDALNIWENMKEHDDKMFLAGEHIKAGNWDEVIKVLTPISSLKYPADQRIYIYLLTAATKGFTDYELLDYSKRRLAADSWDNLSNLNSITSEMKCYSREKYCREHNQVQNATSRILLWFVIAAIAAIIAAICFVTASYSLTFIFVNGVIGCLIIAALTYAGNIASVNANWNINQNPFR